MPKEGRRRKRRKPTGGEYLAGATTAKAVVDDGSSGVQEEIDPKDDRKPAARSRGRKAKSQDMSLSKSTGVLQDDTGRHSSGRHTPSWKNRLDGPHPIEPATSSNRTTPEGRPSSLFGDDEPSGVGEQGSHMERLREAYLHDLIEPHTFLPKEDVSLAEWASIIAPDPHQRMMDPELRPRQCKGITISHTYELNDSMCSELIYAAPEKLRRLRVDSSAEVGNDLIAYALSALPELQELTVCHCPFVSDTGFKCGGRCPAANSLTSLDVTATNISSTGLLNVVTVFANLRTLVLDQCLQVSDRGMRGIADRLHLRHLSIAGCHGISDEGVVTVLASPQHLESLVLDDCPQLTDRTFDAFRLVPSVAGMIPNRSLRNLKRLSIANNPHATEMIAQNISTVAGPTLETLCLEGCPEVDASQAINSLAPCSMLSHVDFRGCKCLKGAEAVDDPERVVQDYLHQVLAKDLKRLTGLMIGGQHVSDTCISMLVALRPRLQHLALRFTPMSTPAVSGAGGRLPGIAVLGDLQTLDVSGSAHLEDRDIKKISQFCKRLRDFRFAWCTRVTDEGFVRIMGLHKLEFLDVSHCAQLTGHFTRYLARAPLRTLVACGLPCFRAHAAARLGRAVGSTLRNLDMRDCPHLNAASVEDLVRGTLWAERVNIRGARGVDMQALQSVSRWHPFLDPCEDPSKDMFGFVASNRGRTCMRRLEAVCAWSRRNRAAVVVTNFMRTVRESVQTRNRMLANLDTLTVGMIRLQAQCRGMLGRQQVRRRRRLGQFLAFCVSRWYHRHMARRMEIARAHYRQQLVRGAWSVWTQLLEEALAAKRKEMRLLDMERALTRKQQSKTLTHAFQAWMEVFVDVLEHKDMTEVAHDHWGGRTIRDLFPHWTRQATRRREIRDALVPVFLTAVPVETWNSRRQQFTLDVAKRFRRTRLLTLAFQHFVVLNQELNAVKLLWPVAEAHHTRVFRAKMLPLLHSSWRRYAREQRILRQKVEKAQANIAVLKLQRSIMVLRDRVKVMKRQRLNLEEGYTFWAHAVAGLTLGYFDLTREERQRAKAADKRADRQHELYSYRLWFTRLNEQRGRQMEMEQLSEKAVEHVYMKTQRQFFTLWQAYHQFVANAEAYVEQRYLQHLKKKILRAFQRHKEEVQNERRELAEMKEEEQYMRDLLHEEEVIREAEELKARLHAEELEQAMAVMAQAVVRIQSAWRSKKTRMDVEEWRVFREWAVLKVQCRFRLRQAKKAARQKRKIVRLRIYKELERELDLMREEEAYERWFMYHEANAITIQRWARGTIARIQFEIFKIETVRERHKDWNQDQSDAIEAARKFHREQELLRMLQEEKLGDVQRVVRGFLGRCRYKRFKLAHDQQIAATTIQNSYRTFLAAKRCAGHRRDRDRMALYRRARLRQGKFLRFFGWNVRSIQRPVLEKLTQMGLDPMSYRYNVRELLAEMKTDMADFKQDARMTYEAIRAGIKKRGRIYVFDFDRFNAKRRDLVADVVRDDILKKGDTVRIVASGHPFVGRSGYVLKVDTSKKGNPIIEVKLDHNDVIAFFRVSSDPTVMYTTEQALHKIDAQFKRGFYPSDESTNDGKLPPRKLIKRTATELRQERLEYVSARRIQRAYRFFRGRKHVGKRRYEFWQRIAAARHVVVDYFSNTGAFTKQSAWVSILLGLAKSSEMPLSLMNMPSTPPALQLSYLLEGHNLDLREELEKRLQERKAFIDMFPKSSTTPGYLRHFRMMTGGGVTRFNIKEGIRSRTTYALADRFKARDTRDGSGEGFLSVLARAIGGKAWQMPADTRRTWTNKFRFGSFGASPHVRFTEFQLFHGMWKGVRIERMRPHGEGLIWFLDGWGLAEEEKTLNVTFRGARDLIAADLDTSDPYVRAVCNHKQVQTSVKFKTLHPTWNESFSMDVTNPHAQFVATVYDWDQFGGDEFLGQITIPVSKLADGKPHSQWYELMSDDPQEPYDTARGDIWLTLQWGPNETEDDFNMKARQEVATVVLQAWVRQILAWHRVERLKREREKHLQRATEKAIVIQTGVRMRRARKFLWLLRRRLHMCVKLQCRIRIFLSKCRLHHKFEERDATTLLQSQWRIYQAKATLFKLILAREKDISDACTGIQKYMRRTLAKREMKAMREEAGLPPLPTDGRRRRFPPIEPWIETYGTDPEYPTKRTRRIAGRVFEQMLQMPKSKLWSRYGEVFVEAYPPPAVSTEKGDELRDAAQFVAVQLPGHTDLRIPKNQRRKVKATMPLFYSVLRLSDMDIRKTADRYAIIVQCWYRGILAVRVLAAQQIEIHAAKRIQKNFRNWKAYRDYHRGIRDRFLRTWNARWWLMRYRRDFRAAVMVQCAFRCYQARNFAAKHRQIRKVKVVGYSSFRTPFHPALVLEDKIDTLWASKGVEEDQYILFDFKRKQAIESVQILPRAGPASPTTVRIFSQFTRFGRRRLVLEQNIPLSKHWVLISIGKLVTRFVRVEFSGTHGDPSNMICRRVVFLKAREQSANILTEPTDLLLEKGPIVGDPMDVRLVCNASGWPPPTYQWQMDGKDIKGATTGELLIRLRCPADEVHKRYRCPHCKRVSKHVPHNAYTIECRNCRTHFEYQDIQPYREDAAELNEQVRKVDTELKAARVKLEKLTKELEMVQKAAEEQKAAEDEASAAQNEMDRAMKKSMSLFDDSDDEASTGDGEEEEKRELARRPSGMADIVRSASTLSKGGVRSTDTGDDDDASEGSKRPANPARWASSTSLGIAQSGDNAEEGKGDDEEEGMEEILATLREREAELVEKRFWLMTEHLRVKREAVHANPYFGEGVYQCIVKNVRGKSYEIRRESAKVVVFVHDPSPYPAKVRKEYKARKRGKRRTWSKYNSLYGWLAGGEPTGRVLVRYDDGSIYDGPYIAERFINNMGATYPLARGPTHWGVWVTPSGRVYEGPLVDNHFDISNIQGRYRVTYEGGELYEGEIVDEDHHGAGQFKYADGSVYEGEWFRGTRAGYGVLRTPDGASYEGEWDSNKVHGDGVYRWADGSMYIGPTFFGVREGFGIYVSRHHDVYKGEFQKDSMTGQGTMIYSNGAYYEGKWEKSQKHGLGKFVDSNGIQYVGQYERDRKEGEFIVRTPIEAGDFDEIRVGTFRADKLVKWLTHPVDPRAAAQFKHFFESSDEEFDGVFALVIARYLPNLPHGLDETDPQVQAILERIKREGGDLVGVDARVKALEVEAQLKASLKVAQDEFLVTKRQLDALRRNVFEKEERSIYLMRQLDVYNDRVSLLSEDLNQFWLDDKDETRYHFNKLVARVKREVSKEDWFQLKNYTDPPPILKTIMMAMSSLLLDNTEWRFAQRLLSDSAFNLRKGDETAVSNVYDCKLVFLMENFDPFPILHSLDNLTQARDLRADPKYRPDNYFVNLVGRAASYVLLLLYGALDYIDKARDIQPKRVSLQNNIATVTRLRKDLEKAQVEEKKVTEDSVYMEEKVEMYKSVVDDLTAQVATQRELIDYCSEAAAEFERMRVDDPDYYEQLEIDLMADEIRFPVETTMELMMKELEAREEREKLDQQRERRQHAIALGLSPDDLEEEPPITLKDIDLRTWINDEVSYQRGVLAAEGVPAMGLRGVFGGACTQLTQRINKLLKEPESLSSWGTPSRGVVFNRFLLFLLAKRWYECDQWDEDQRAMGAWEGAFPEPDTAFMALVARVNQYMSENARYEAAVWETYHPQEMIDAEHVVAAQFVADCETPPEFDEHGVEVKEGTYIEPVVRMFEIMDAVEDVSPEDLSAATVWAKLNPRTVEARWDAMQLEMAKEFEGKYKDDSLQKACELRNIEEHEWRRHAESWAVYNLEAVTKYEQTTGQELAVKFKNSYPLNTARSAYDMLRSEETSDVLKQAASAWAGRHCKAMLDVQAQVDKEKADEVDEMWKDAHKIWDELFNPPPEEVRREEERLRKLEELKRRQTMQRQASLRAAAGEAMAAMEEEDDKPKETPKAKLARLLLELQEYYTAMQSALDQKIFLLQRKNPAYRVLHNYRPSECFKERREWEEQYWHEMGLLREKHAHASNQLQDIAERLGDIGYRGYEAYATGRKIPGEADESEEKDNSSVGDGGEEEKEWFGSDDEDGA